MFNMHSFFFNIIINIFAVFQNIRKWKEQNKPEDLRVKFKQQPKSGEEKKRDRWAR